MKKLILAVLLCTAVQALDSGDSKFMKEYALLKIYESCFGTTLLKQITQELKDADAKCSAPPVREHSNAPGPAIFIGKLPPGFDSDPNTQTITKPTDGAISHQEHETQYQDQPNPVGGIFSFRPQGTPFPQQIINPYMTPAAPQFRPFGPAVPMYQYPYAAPGFAPPGVSYNPFFPPYQQFYQQPFVGSNRMSRQLGGRARLGMNNTPRMHPFHNETCVMQELGYLDQNMEPNYPQILQRINNLLMPDEFKIDLMEGLQFCKKFSQCVPEEKRETASRPTEMIKSVFFFRCYKHKKLEACIMKDVNEHFSKDYVLETADASHFASLSRSSRSIRDLPPRDPSLEALEEMEVYLYDYLRGGGSFDFDLYI